MSEGEQKLADQRGKFAQVVKDGRKVPDVEWIGGRILLSTKRIVLVSNEGKRTIPLSKIRSIKGRQNANQPLAQVSSYISLQMGGDVTLLSPKDHEEFEQTLYRAILDQQVILAKHPAVEGGVVQDTGWEKGRLKIDDGEVNLAIATGQFVEIEIDDVGTVEQNEATIKGDERPLIEVEHTDKEGTAVETHISGTPQHVMVLASLLRKGEQKNTTDAELSDRESEVLMALYSGVSPFQIPEFVGMDVDTVEDIFDDLVEQGILEEQRTRREVQLKARGRHIASEAMDEA
ncbi:CheF family chemotaxis protein [Salinibaculum rarum]|uniref:CheF family chemotaxis protein n=1 Tax=Salinibaculum rarum TaxID=3058903 RepID=UPI002660079E|nr:CheF family chemotaxis protein [Salinibaculum sp. KK48]